MPAGALQLDTTIHSPIRLQICALLMPLEKARFKVLQDEIQVSDSVLSKHLRRLEEAGYLNVEKASEAGRQQTWVNLTEKGRKAFARQVAELKRLIQTASGS